MRTRGARDITARLGTAAGAAAAAAGAAALGAAPWAQVGAALAAAAALALSLPRTVPPRPEGPAAVPAPARLEPGLGRLALDRLPGATLVIEATGRIVYANAAALTLFERLRVGEHYSASFRAPDFLDALGRALADGASARFDFTLHGDRTRQIEAQVDGGLIHAGPAGPVRHVLCLFQDRTQEARLTRLRTDFVANASHELRTPLASIRGFVETLLGPARDDPEARDRFLAIMLAQTERMTRLIDDLLSLSRIELNEHVPPSATLDLARLARETAEAMGPQAAARGVTLDVTGTEAPAPIRGDRDQLTQALGNLIDNALKYGGGKPVSLTLHATHPTRPGLTGLSVTDRGEGIARDHLHRLTERFYRVSAKRSRDQGGTGLGLAIVKHIATRHRGELQVDSTLGEGTRVTLWLPAAPDPTASPARADHRMTAPTAADF